MITHPKVKTRAPMKRKKSGLWKYNLFFYRFKNHFLAKAEEEHKQIHIGMRENEKFSKYQDNWSLEAAFNEVRSNEVRGILRDLMREVSVAVIRRLVLLFWTHTGIVFWLILANRSDIWGFLARVCDFWFENFQNSLFPLVVNNIQDGGCSVSHHPK